MRLCAGEFCKGQGGKEYSTYRPHSSTGTTWSATSASGRKWPIDPRVLRVEWLVNLCSHRFMHSSLLLYMLVLRGRCYGDLIYLPPCMKPWHSVPPMRWDGITFTAVTLSMSATRVWSGICHNVEKVVFWGGLGCFFNKTDK